MADMTVSEAGRRGGEARVEQERLGNPKGQISVSEAGRIGGKANAAKYGHAHFVAIGRKGGARMGAIIKAGKEALAKQEAENA
jgi:general stress protein YciG